MTPSDLDPNALEKAVQVFRYKYWEGTVIRNLLFWLLQKCPVADEEELGHQALCAWNGWIASASTRKIWSEIWTREAPASREAWKRVVRVIVAVKEQR